MFSINAGCLVVAFLYSLVRLDWATTPQQRPLQPSSLCSCDVNQNGLLDFFDKDHLVESVKTIIKKRPNHGRLFIFILIISLALYTFQRGGW